MQGLSKWTKQRLVKHGIHAANVGWLWHLPFPCKTSYSQNYFMFNPQSPILNSLLQWRLKCCWERNELDVPWISYRNSSIYMCHIQKWVLGVLIFCLLLCLQPSYPIPRRNRFLFFKGTWLRDWRYSCLAESVSSRLSENLSPKRKKKSRSWLGKKANIELFRQTDRQLVKWQKHDFSGTTEGKGIYTKI